MRKNPHSRILKGKLKEQHLSIVPKSCPYIYIYIYNSLEVLLLFIYFEIQKIKIKHHFKRIDSLSKLPPFFKLKNDFFLLHNMYVYDRILYGYTWRFFPLFFG